MVYNSYYLLLLQLSRVRVCVTQRMAAHQALPYLGFSRQEHWSGLSYIAINDYYIKKYICTSNFCSGFQNPGRVAGDGQDIALNHRDLWFFLVIDDWYYWSMSVVSHSQWLSDLDLHPPISCLCFSPSPPSFWDSLTSSFNTPFLILSETLREANTVIFFIWKYS